MELLSADILAQATLRSAVRPFVMWALIVALIVGGSLVVLYAFFATGIYIFMSLPLPLQLICVIAFIGFLCLVYAALVGGAPAPDSLGVSAAIIMPPVPDSGLVRSSCAYREAHHLPPSTFAFSMLMKWRTKPETTRCQKAGHLSNGHPSNIGDRWDVPVLGRSNDPVPLGSAEEFIIRVEGKPGGQPWIR